MNKTKCYNCNIEYYSKTGFQFEKCNHTFCPFCLSAKFMSSLSVNYNAAFPRAKIKCSCCSKNAIDLCKVIKSNPQIHILEINRLSKRHANAGYYRHNTSA